MSAARLRSALPYLVGLVVALDRPQRPDRGNARGRVRLLVAGDPLQDLDLLGNLHLGSSLWGDSVFFTADYTAVF